ncbi:MAG: alpha/beta hydrolase [Ferrovibrio sp.]|uniref:dienelactone hydrolase family protein n=1 Tax=Ferrovibrio sp. TaxID=1917215 RepID=UPI002617DDE9|nr:alpha/beta hydrolase [Ferrovibrio sp.]MCW0234803.1 alpha/beta hydrolase [Ferrovibrio sp.]
MSASQPVTIDEIAAIPPFGLDAHLVVPGQATGIVLFAHGSGSSRHSPRNTFVAHALTQAGIGTLLFDLLTPAEAEDRAMVFDVALLAERLVLATRWLLQRMDRVPLEIGYFGASTGAAAALIAAASESSLVKAVVSRGGRPDLANRFLPHVRAPTLLIVGGDDRDVLALNRRALARMTCRTALQIVPNAGHLFEEPGALDQVIDGARSWFRQNFRKPGTGGSHVS